jgi:hypothetical protein
MVMYLAWDPFSHMAFRLNEASTGSIAAFAEDYRIVQTPGYSMKRYPATT